jgi:hypothetical protein
MELSNRAKQILEVDKLEVVADANYFDSGEIKKCIDDGIIPYIPDRGTDVRKDLVHGIKNPSLLRRGMNWYHRFFNRTL